MEESNFFCLKNSFLDIHQANVLISKNGGGKLCMKLMIESDRYYVLDLYKHKK